MKVLVLGSNGLVGSAIREQAKDSRHTFIFATRKDADLTKEDDVDGLVNQYRPMCIINCAALCGGIGGNEGNPVSFFRKNVFMNSNILQSAHRYGVDKVLMFSSVCVFPYEAEVVDESMMLEGHPFESNASYGWAKRMIDVEISAYKKQYGNKQWTSIIPGNIIGPQDNYSLTNGHVLPALIHKIFLAKKENKSISCWGDGSAKREFIYSKDLARILLQIIELSEIPQRIIVSGEQQISIKELVERLCVAADFKCGVVWDSSRPTGQKARSSNISLLKSLIKDVKITELDEALRESYQWFEQNYPNVRL